LLTHHAEREASFFVTTTVAEEASSKAAGIEEHNRKPSGSVSPVPELAYLTPLALMVAMFLGGFARIGGETRMWFVGAVLVWLRKMLVSHGLRNIFGSCRAALCVGRNVLSCNAPT